MKPNRFNTKNLTTGFLYFYIHFVTETICFFVLAHYTESAPIMWLITFTFDVLAFTPQGLFGYISDKHKKVSFGAAGLVLLGCALLLQRFTSWTFVSLVVMCIGNAFTHINGAEVTLRTANGSLSHSAIFVAGGSFGIVTGKFLAAAGAPYWLVLLLAATAIPFAILAQLYLKNDAASPEAVPCSVFQFHNPKINKYLVILLSVIVVIVRGFMAYGIPISWKKTTLQTVILFAFMGVGKALGGVLADLFGVKKVALASISIALPFLLFGNEHMFVSLIGVMFFSMTMSVTLAVLVSVMPKTPGLAFGLTTIGLFLGAAPVFFFRIASLTANCIMLSALTAVCLVCMYNSIRKDERHEQLV